MSAHRKNLKVAQFDNAMKYLGAVMVVLYVATGTAILMDKGNYFNVPDQYALPLGLAMIFYGIFRGYRNYRKYFRR